MGLQLKGASPRRQLFLTSGSRFSRVWNSPSPRGWRLSARTMRPRPPRFSLSTGLRSLCIAKNKVGPEDLQNHRGDGRRGKNEAEYLLTPGTTADAAPATVQH